MPKKYVSKIKYNSIIITPQDKNSKTAWRNETVASKWAGSMQTKGCKGSWVMGSEVNCFSYFSVNVRNRWRKSYGIEFIRTP